MLIRIAHIGKNGRTYRSRAYFESENAFSPLRRNVLHFDKKGLHAWIEFVRL